MTTSTPRSHRPRRRGPSRFPVPPSRPAIIALVAIATLVASCAAGRSETPLDAAIAFHERSLRADPGLHAARTALGEALLERARVTHDPRDVARARLELERSLATQESFAAYKAMAALCNFSHRFDEALEWADLASAAYPEDTGVTAQRVESLLAIGQIDAARAAMDRGSTGRPDFWLAAAEARWQSAAGDPDAAAEAFMRAARLAGQRGLPPLVVWANVGAAAAMIDSGRAADAAPFLDAAASIDPDSPLLRVHQAEFLAATGSPADAAAMYDRLLAEYPDPVVHAAAAGLARDMGDNERGEHHFAAAETGFRRAIDAGEVYTLEAMARLYLGAGKRLDEALALAEENAKHKRDADARALLETIRERMAARAAASDR